MRTGNGEQPGNAISLPCYLWPADLGFRAALTKLIEDRVRVSEHIAMRPGPDTFSIEVLSLSRKTGGCRARTPDTTRPPVAGAQAAGPVLAGPCFTAGRGTTMSFRSRAAPAEPWNHEGR